MHKDFIVVPIDKGARNIALVCKGFYASFIAKELELNNNSSTNTYKRPTTYLQMMLLIKI